MGQVLSSVKPEQLEVVSAILKGELETIWIECLFPVPPSLFVLFNIEDAPSIVVVLTPLTAIVKYQVSMLF